MQVAVIGTGNVGKALGGALVRAGHKVTFGGRDAAKTRHVAAEFGGSAAATPAEAARQAQVIVLAIPFSGLDAVAGELRSATAGKVVIDVTNPLKPDMSGLVTEGGPSAGERIAAQLPDAKVVKAFNTLFASVQGNPDAHGITLDALFATDDPDTREVVSRLIRSLGFRAVSAGPLAAARELEAIAWLNMKIQMGSNGDWRSSFVLVGAPAGAVAEPALAAAR